MEVRSSLQSLYRNQHHLLSPEATEWKEKLVSSCVKSAKSKRREIVQALRSRRMNLQNSFDLSQVAVSIVKGEVKKSAEMGAVAGVPAVVSDDDSGFMEEEPSGSSMVDLAPNSAEYVEVMTYLESVVLEELKKEECVLQEYERMRAEEEEAIVAAAAVEQLYEGTGGSSSTQVLCPVCKSDWLVTGGGGRVFLCRCGFRFNTQHDGISLQFLQDQLARCYSEHRAACPAEPAFSVQDNFGVHMLHLGCTVCGCVKVVI